VAVARRRAGIALARCLATDALGNLVYIRDVFDGVRYDVTSANPAAASCMPCVGCIIEKQSATLCTVMFFGFTDLYSGLEPGESYVVGTDARPAGYGDSNYPRVGMLHQQIGVATDDNELLFRPQDAGQRGASSVAGSRCFHQPLPATADPRVFTTSSYFRHGGLDTEVIIYDGQRLREGVGHDYVASESGGVGTGFDTVTLVFTPDPDANWFIDYCERDPAPPTGYRYYQQELTPTADPHVFTTPVYFRHGGVETEVVVYDGQRLREGVGHDYVASESGGAGTGYDTITLQFDPDVDVNWFIDYTDATAIPVSGSGVLVQASEPGVAPGNHTLTGLADKFALSVLRISTLSTDWTFTIYSKIDYLSDPVMLLDHRGGDCACYWDYPYEDKDGTASIHYAFLDNTGLGNVYNISVLGRSLA
jgi:hypothetical protein